MPDKIRIPQGNNEFRGQSSVERQRVGASERWFNALTLRRSTLHAPARVVELSDCVPNRSEQVFWFVWLFEKANRA